VARGESPVIALALLALAIATVVTGLVRRRALDRSLLDQPNARSSHARPVPRGGGVGPIAALVLVLVLARPDVRSDARALAALGAVLLAAAVGWRDDHGGLPVRARLVVHLAAGLLLLPLALLPWPVVPWLGWGAAIWWVFWTISCVNVVNFVDGIDGLIGSQALVFGLFCWQMGAEAGSARAFGAVLAGASMGFLLWNWAPARIFLGDVGSGALGASMAVGGLLLLREGRVSLVAAYLPLFAIFLDAATTLARRWRRGARLSEAHREHLYQRLANECRWGHARVTLLYAAAAASAVPAVVMHDRLGPVLHIAAVSLTGWGLDRRAERCRPRY
jgi:Fuc2NAc and GlcNAc transferase